MKSKKQDNIPSSSKKKPKKSAHPVGSIRIIAGKWRSRKIDVIDQDGLRPTTNRIKETVFNWLQMHLPGAQVLDVFSGTGSLGLEALSRGAEFCHFNEISLPAIQRLKQNISILDANEMSQVGSQDARKLLCNQSEKTMDVVFLDPPFDLDIYQDCFELLQEYGWVKSGSLVYCESSRRKTVDIPRGWEIKKEKVAGQVCSRLLLVGNKE